MSTPNEEIPTRRAKNAKRVAAGKKGAEAKKLKAELKRREIEEMKKENTKLKITKDDEESITSSSDKQINDYFFPIIISIGISAGFGLYMFKNKSKKVTPVVETPKKKEIDPFEFN